MRSATRSPASALALSPSPSPPRNVSSGNASWQPHLTDYKKPAPDQSGYMNNRRVQQHREPRRIKGQQQAAARNIPLEPTLRPAITAHLQQQRTQRSTVHRSRPNGLLRCGVSKRARICRDGRGLDSVDLPRGPSPHSSIEWRRSCG